MFKYIKIIMISMKLLFGMTLTIVLKFLFIIKKEDADNTVKYLANTFSLPFNERD